MVKETFFHRTKKVLWSGRKWEVIEEHQNDQKDVKDQKRGQENSKIIVHRVGDAEHKHAQQKEDRQFRIDEIKGDESIKEHKKCQLPAIDQIWKYKDVHQCGKGKAYGKQYHQQGRLQWAECCQQTQQG